MIEPPLSPYKARSGVIVGGGRLATSGRAAQLPGAGIEGAGMLEADGNPKACASHRVVWPFSRGEDCYAAWKAALSQLVDCSIPADADVASFEFHGSSWQLPETFVQVNGGSAMSMSRPQHVIDDRPISKMSLYLLTGGSVVTDYDGCKRIHVPGDVVAVDYSLPYESYTSGYEGIALTFDKASTLSELQGDVHGMMLAANSSAGNILGGQMRSLVAHIDGLNVLEAQSAVNGILQFAAATLPTAAPRTLRGDHSVLHRAYRLARTRMSDPDFGPADLALELGMSRSKLFRSFEEHGGVQRWLLGKRLTASLQAIVRSAGNQKISAIAHQHGFRSEAHFSRAFRKRYEMSPSSALAFTKRSQGASKYLGWAQKNTWNDRSTVEAWLASAQASELEGAG
ncbi:MAG: helix-turn-helix transcriptional regulator [Shinella sp.]|uniref:helix-turn-helix transcriptional regulator n=1 Tax=Shinella sp. TaxID=1870904 RepID=UPI00403637FD